MQKILQDTLSTMEKLRQALELDLLLLEAEAAHGLMDGLPLGEVAQSG